jgi:hypothetical protein
MQHRIELLKNLLRPISVGGRYDNLLLTIGDYHPNYWGEDQGPVDDIYRVSVGFGSADIYTHGDDWKIIQLLKDKLLSIVRECGGYSSKREELINVIEDWARQAHHE